MRTIDDISGEIRDLREQVAAFEHYRDVCIRRHDRHGVMDAEADMREMESRVRALEWVLGATIADRCAEPPRP